MSRGNECLTKVELTLLYSWALVFQIRDMFHVYLNRFEFHFLRLHINKTKFYFFMINGRVPGIAK